MVLMTTGKPMKVVGLFMIPFLIGNIFQEIYNLVDSIIVGQFLGVDAFAGVSCASVVMKIFTEFVLGINSGFVVVFSQEFGSKNKAGFLKCISASMRVAFLLSIVLTALAILVSKPLLEITNTPCESFGYALEFMFVSCFGLPAIMAYNFFSGIAKATGNSKIPLFFLILTAIFNVGFDYFNVFVLNLGVFGVAFATIISQVISSILCASYIFKKCGFVIPNSKKERGFSWLYAKKCLKIALPTSFGFIISALGRVFLQVSINDLGVDAVSGYNIARKIDSVLTLAFLALSSAIAPYVAQNFGSGKIKRISQGVRAGIAIGMMFCVVFGVFMCLFWEQLVGLFIAWDEWEVKKTARQYIQIAISAYPAYCLLIMFRNVNRALSKTIALIFADGLEIFMRSFGSIVLTLLLGYVGACLSIVLSWYFAFGVLIFQYVFAVNKLEKKV